MSIHTTARNENSETATSAPNVRTFVDVFTELARRVGARRGFVELDSGPRWPRSTGGDVLVISDAVERSFEIAKGSQGYGEGDDPKARMLEAEWSACRGDVKRLAPAARSAVYSENREFWTQVQRVLAYCDANGAFPPEPIFWAQVFRDLELPPPPRNGVWPRVSRRGDRTFVEVCGAVEAELAASRGLDRRRMPRMTTADALVLLTMWSGVFDRMVARYQVASDGLAERWGRLIGDTLAAAAELRLDDRHPLAQRILFELRRLASHFDRTRELAGEGFRNATSEGENLVDVWGAQLRHLKALFGSVRGPGGSEVPNTTVSDVLGLVAFWTDKLADVDPARAHGEGVDSDRPQWTPFDGAISSWRALVAHTVATAKGLGENDPYPENWWFWDGLGDFAVALEGRRREVARSRARFSIGGNVRSFVFRNATMTVVGDEAKFDGVKDLVDVWGAQLRYFKDKHGTVLEPNPPAGQKPGELPNTTVGEVLWLADFWTKRLDQVDADNTSRENLVYEAVRHLTGPKRVDGTDDAIAAWRELVAHTIATAKGLKEEDPYPENWTFWDGLGTWAVALNTLSRTPVSTHFVEAFKHAVKNLPQTLHTAEQWVVNETTKTVGAIYEGTKKVASDAAGGVSNFFSGLSKPVLIGGACILGAVVAVPLLLRD